MKRPPKKKAPLVGSSGGFAMGITGISVSKVQQNQQMVPQQVPQQQQQMRNTQNFRGIQQQRHPPRQLQQQQINQSNQNQLGGVMGNAIGGHKIQFNVKNMNQPVAQNSIKYQKPRPTEVKVNPSPPKRIEQAQPAQLVAAVNQISPEELREPDSAGISPDAIKNQKEEAKVEESPVSNGPIIGEVRVRYNHYNKPFQITDGALKWGAVDDQFSFSFVFQGNFKLNLFPEKQKGQYVEQKDRTFLNLIDGEVYMIEVEEDEEAEGKIERTGYIMPTAEVQKKTAAQMLTEELKGMSLEEIEAKGAKFQEIHEARELEEILFS